MNIQVKVKSTIIKPIQDVYNAIVDNEKISGYFVSKASEKMASGKSIIWEFKDHDVSFQVDVLEVIENQLISFRWSASGEIGIVNIFLNEKNNSSTDIEITEDFIETTKDMTSNALQQTQGWTDFICSLKAYLYTGINLRNGQYN